MHGNVVMSLYATVATGCNDCNGCNRHVSDEEMKSTESTEDAFPQIPMPVAWSSEALNGIDRYTVTPLACTAGDGFAFGPRLAAGLPRAQLA